MMPGSNLGVTQENNRTAYYIAAAAVAVILAVLAWNYSTKEGFSTVREKATRAVDYFRGAKEQPRYTDYRAHMQEQSNTYEYWNLSQLRAKGKLSVDTASTVLR